MVHKAQAFNHEKANKLRYITSQGVGLFHLGGKFTRESEEGERVCKKGLTVPAGVPTLKAFISSRNNNNKNENGKAPLPESSSLSPVIKKERKMRDKLLLISDPQEKGSVNKDGRSNNSNNNNNKPSVHKYWTHRVAKIENQKPDLSIYAKLDIVQQGTLITDPESGEQSLKQIFKGFSFYFNGLTNELTNTLSQLHLTHLARLHGASVLPYLAKKQLTHIVCENVCQSKQERELSLKRPCKFTAARMVEGVPHKSSRLVYVKPAWIEESIRAGVALPERDFATFVNRSNHSIDNLCKNL